MKKVITDVKLKAMFAGLMLSPFTLFERTGLECGGGRGFAGHPAGATAMVAPATDDGMTG